MAMGCDHRVGLCPILRSATMHYNCVYLSRKKPTPSTLVYVEFSLSHENMLISLLFHGFSLVWVLYGCLMYRLRGYLQSLPL